MEERQVSFTLGVTCQTPYEKLVEIPGMIQEIIEAQPRTRFGRAHFKAYGDFSLNFEIVYYVLTSDYGVFMDIQQAINLEIFRRFAEEGIEFSSVSSSPFSASVVPSSFSAPDVSSLAEPRATPARRSPP
jgi:small-conductance mechanosensitive channel